MARRFAYRLGWRSLRKVAPGLSNARYREMARSLAQAMVEHEITTEKRAVDFIAQAAHESDGFHTTREYASGAEYEGRGDLGNTHTGDGKRFKGRGYIQVTGRTNYSELPRWGGIDFLRHPQRLEDRQFAARSAAWWWKKHGCNELADKGDFVALTRKINGGTNGLASRQAYRARARHVAKYLVPKRRPPS